MQQLLCEPEDRIGSQAASSTTRPNSFIMQARRSGFINPHGGPLSVDGADIIKVRLPFAPRIKALTIGPQAHPWFRGIDWENIHRYPAPYHPELRDPADTKHFDDDIPAEVCPYLDRSD
jgi:protein-serine/threonine kinase